MPNADVGGSSAEGHSHVKRPPAMARQSSTSSQRSQSSSDHKPAVHKAPRQHVVGQSRMRRNVSTGKELNKLTKLTQAHGGEGNSRHHRRYPSGGKDSSSVSSSPRPGFKRNASTGSVLRAAHQQHAHTALRKNLSSSHLARQGHHTKAALKSSRSEVAPPKRSLLQTSKARERERSPEGRPTVQFDVGDDGSEGADDGWTEESASQSPTTTRSNTRSNSVILEQQKAMEKPATEQQSAAAQSSQNEPQDDSSTHTLPDRTKPTHSMNGGESHPHRSRPPDADVITSRLLQRSFHNIPTAQVSPAALTVVSETARKEGRKEIKVLSHSTGSTLVDTPGRDLVSRFMDAGSSAGTPKGSSFLPSRNSPQSAGDDFDQAKRNKSMPNFAEVGGPSSKAPPRRSGTSTPDDPPYQSRTQQKLMLQRASSNIEPNKLVPAVLPRGAVPNGYVNAGMTFAASGEGRLDPRLQQQFNHVAVEYKVVRRYRNPLGDAILRIRQLPGVAEKIRRRDSRAGKGWHGVHPHAGAANGTPSVHGASSLSTSLTESGVETGAGEGAGHGRRRSRVSFEGMEMGREEREGGDGAEGRQSFESGRSVHGNGGGSKIEAEVKEMIRKRTEAEEVCRRLWESTEVVEGE